jgi:GT2 family glycosyltransferase
LALRAFIAKHPRLAEAGERAARRFPRIRDLVRFFGRSASVAYGAWVARFDTLTAADLSALKQQARNSKLPDLAVVVTLEAAAQNVELVVRSLMDQVHDQLDATLLCTTDAEDVSALVDDDRFRLETVAPASLMEARIQAIRTASADFVVLVEGGAQLRPHALFLFAHAVRHSPNAAVVYADDDAIDLAGDRFDHDFKPDWNEELLRAQNYFGAVVCIRRSRADEVFDSRVPVRDIWELLLRLTKGTTPREVHHIPHVLSHRPGRTAHRDGNAEAHRARLAAVGGGVVDVAPAGRASFRITDRPARLASVSIVVPSTCAADVLEPCLAGLLDRTTYAPREVVIVANQRDDDGVRGARDYLENLSSRPNLNVLVYEAAAYNFSRINNWAAARTHGEFLCFLNDDTEVVDADWLSALVATGLRERVAAVGAKLLYPNGRVQHAGVVLGAGTVAAHAYRGVRCDDTGYHDRAVIARDVSCVTAACMLVRRSAFEQIGGFDEGLGIAYNDVDLCLRLRDSGWRIVWTPAAVLTHRESATLGEHHVGRTRNQWKHDEAFVRRRWGRQLERDPHHNPNLSTDPLHLWEPAVRPRVTYPWRSAGVRATTAYSPVS